MKIVIIGGGAAGMMAACTAAERGADVTLIERNSQLGIKVNITGKGRCNVTNDSEPEALIKNTLTNGRFLYSAFAAMSAQDTMAFFERIGVPLKVERGKRVFPVTDNARDITGALKTHLHRLGVTVLQHRVKGIVTKDGAACGVSCCAISLSSAPVRLGVLFFCVAFWRVGFSFCASCSVSRFSVLSGSMTI